MIPVVGVASVLPPLALAIAIAELTSILIPRQYGVREEVNRLGRTVAAGLSLGLIALSVTLQAAGHTGGHSPWPLYWGIAGGLLLCAGTAASAREDARNDVARAATVRELLPAARSTARTLRGCLAAEALRGAAERLKACEDKASRNVGTAAMRELHAAAVALQAAVEADAGRAQLPGDDISAVHQLVATASQHMWEYTRYSGYRTNPRDR